ncbi:MAG: hypothetical protein ACI835_002869 [Planctomycetota bacterium]|jgi:hypothetical protein
MTGKSITATITEYAAPLTFMTALGSSTTLSSRPPHAPKWSRGSGLIGMEPLKLAERMGAEAILEKSLVFEHLNSLMANILSPSLQPTSPG